VLADVWATPSNSTPPGTLGVADFAHDLPFQCQIRAAETGAVPTAQAPPPATLTEEKPPATGFGVVTVSQALPFQCISSVCSGLAGFGQPV
jgi:hypothetical protein